MMMMMMISFWPVGFGTCFARAAGWLAGCGRVLQSTTPGTTREQITNWVFGSEFRLFSHYTGSRQFFRPALHQLATVAVGGLQPVVGHICR
uniref:Putative secreted protein n=1 Tax=Anopheles marajoara TaxID=58244 RepID=A0A2M4C9S6_9DIPT